VAKIKALRQDGEFFAKNGRTPEDIAAGHQALEQADRTEQALADYEKLIQTKAWRERVSSAYQ
jgi:hypothetical protein